MNTKFQQAVEWFYGYLQSCAADGNDMRDWDTLDDIESDTVGLRPVEDLGHNDPDSNKDERFWATAFLMGVRWMYMDEVAHQRPVDKSFEKDLLNRIDDANRFEKYKAKRVSGKVYVKETRHGN
jgi:hypothetical protein